MQHRSRDGSSVAGGRHLPSAVVSGYGAGGWCVLARLVPLARLRSWPATARLLRATRRASHHPGRRERRAGLRALPFARAVPTSARVARRAPPFKASADASLKGCREGGSVMGWTHACPSFLVAAGHAPAGSILFLKRSGCAFPSPSPCCLQASRRRRAASWGKAGGRRVGVSVQSMVYAGGA